MLSYVVAVALVALLTLAELRAGGTLTRDRFLNVQLWIFRASISLWVVPLVALKRTVRSIDEPAAIEIGVVGGLSISQPAEMVKLAMLSDCVPLLRMRRIATSCTTLFGG